MKVKKTLTIVAKLSGSTNNLALLEQEYTNFQLFLNGDDKANLYSATKQQGRRTYGIPKDGKEYPLVVRKDLVKLTQISPTKSKVRIPAYGIRGGIELYASHMEFDFNEAELLGSQIVKDSVGDFYYHITVRQGYNIQKEYDNVLAIDIGSRWIAVVVSTFSRPLFFGKELRNIRGKYYYLRKSTKNKKLFRKKEANKTKDLLHKYVKEITQLAKENNAIIVVGDIHGVRQGRKNKKANRRIHSMPSYLFKTYLEVAATKAGIAVVKVPEHNTSKTCSNCGSINTKRPHQGVFICKDCGYQVNADINGARNILRRGVGYMLASGAAVGRPEEVGGPFHLPQPGLEFRASFGDESEAA